MGIFDSATFTSLDDNDDDNDDDLDGDSDDDDAAPPALYYILSCLPVQPHTPLNMFDFSTD